MALAACVMALAFLVWVVSRHDVSPPAPEPSGRTPSSPMNAGAAQERSASPPAPRKVVLSPAQAAELPPAEIGSLAGRLLSTASGRGVEGAELTFALEGAAILVRSGSDGSFELQPPREGTLRLGAIVAPGFLPFAPEWDQSPIAFVAQRGKAVRGITLYLTPAVEYLGRVLDPGGKPVPGAEVRMIDAGGELTLAPLPDRFTADQAGEFRFLAPDDALLEATHPGFSPGRARLDFPAQASRRLTIRLREGAPAAVRESISGQVLGPTGAPLEGAQVMARPKRPGPDALLPSPEVISGPDGRFELSGLDPGRYDVFAVHPEFVSARAPDVLAGTRDLLLTLAAGTTVVGRVMQAEDDAPIPAFVVSLSRRLGPLQRETVRTLTVLDAEGRFEVRGVAPGPYVLTAAAFGRAPSPEQELDVKPAPAVTRAEVRLAKGVTLVGQVLERGTRRPITDARVTLEGRYPEGTSAVPAVSSTSTDGQGRFTLVGLSPGERSLTVVAASHHGRIVSGVQIPDSGDPDPVEIELSPVEKGEEPELELAGIGAVLSAQGDAMVINKVVPSGGAAEVGLAVGDGILRIDGRPVTDLGFEGCIQRIRGPEGTKVALWVRRASDGTEREWWVPRRLVRSQGR